jgi:hypothetical protein
MAFCNRVMACQLATFAACLSTFTNACCMSAGTCSQTATGMDATTLNNYETACDAAFQAESCADVGAGTIPAACQAPP